MDKVNRQVTFHRTNHKFPVTQRLMLIKLPGPRSFCILKASTGDASRPAALKKALKSVRVNLITMPSLRIGSTDLTLICHVITLKLNFFLVPYM